MNAAERELGGQADYEAFHEYQRAERPNHAGRVSQKFILERFEDIRFDTREEWLIKRILPREGVAAIYGKPGSFKSFVTLDIALSVALGNDWARRRTTQATVVYIAAEGAAGVRKRKAGFERKHPNLPSRVPFYLISAAPNLGTEKGDLSRLVAAIENAGVAPGLIVIDTLSRTLHSADENGPGMVQFVSHANELARRFKALVFVVHHSGLSEEKRMRGHSSLNGALDAVILCERRERELTAYLTLQKLKDEASDITLAVTLSPVVVGVDEDHEDSSTLVVSGVKEAESIASKLSKGRPVPPAQRLLMEALGQAVDKRGESFHPSPDGPSVKGVSEEIVRDCYYERIGEKADPAEDPEKLAARRRKAFNRSIKGALDRKLIIAAEHNGERYLWPATADERDSATPLKGGVTSRHGSKAQHGVGHAGTNQRSVTSCPAEGGVTAEPRSSDASGYGCEIGEHLPKEEQGS